MLIWGSFIFNWTLNIFMSGHVISPESFGAKTHYRVSNGPN